MQTKELNEIFKALAEPTRLKILLMLKDKKLCGYHILDKLSISQPTLSHHMRILCNAGLVKAEKDWKWIYYSVNTTTIKEIELFLNNLN